jgi:hypothetical protein
LGLHQKSQMVFAAFAGEEVLLRDGGAPCWQCPAAIGSSGPGCV